ncbi:hypothetical protein [Rivibacter subsaxonicus]|uniref:Uncharacterized protein n=1 Tax=Rivibacter subsaxonicus TaxID=457575 RepID=A0A4Q7W1P0_9BURK|nr:hypothetical protein [Rivibacter subsaxonicus]RZU03070.1 hypothetical protein EV670_1103 [Rivibacter subsaxonicus]
MNCGSPRSLICRDKLRVLGLVLVLAGASPLAHAELVNIAWDGQGRFERRATLAPGKFLEVCGKLSRGQAIAWSFKSDGPLNFNIHYHEGDKVEYPARRDAVAELEGRLEAGLDQDYCWMWSNKSERAADLHLMLSR